MEAEAISCLLLFVGVVAALVTGFPVAFALGGSAVLMAGIGSYFGTFDAILLGSLPARVLDIGLNPTLVAVPLFVLMGTVLERSKVAENLLITMGQLFGSLRGGLGISVVLVGALLAASTGIVGATIVTMALISLPAMQRARYDQSLSSGIICASGTLAQLIPPSTVLILLGTALQNANTQAKLRMGIFSSDPVTVTDLFAGALVPGLVLVGLYVVWIVIRAALDPESCPPVTMSEAERTNLPARILFAMLPPLGLIVLVLGSILTGLATATESAALGGVGAVLLALMNRQLSLSMLADAARSAMSISLMIYAILIGATIFSLVFRGFGGEDVVIELLHSLPAGAIGATIFVLGLMFLLGFLIDTFEIIFIVVPIFAPGLIMQGVDPLWLGVAAAVILQTSYLTPPFGFGIFYLQGASSGLSLPAIYRGVVPFVVIQLLAVVLLSLWPELIHWLPGVLSG